MPLYVGYILKDVRVLMKNGNNVELNKKDMFCINRFYTRAVRNMIKDHVPSSYIMEVLQCLAFFQQKYEERYLNSVKGYYRLKYIDPFLEGYYACRLDEMDCGEYCSKLLKRLRKWDGEKVVQIDAGRQCCYTRK